jgi:predicted metal-dependent peptidase
MTTPAPKKEFSEEDIANMDSAVNKAKIDLMRKKNTIFFSSLLSQIRIALSTYNDTAWTDCTNIGLAPGFVNQCNTGQLLWTLMHELGHIIFDHIPIAIEHNLNLRKHNIGTDHYINLWLKALGFEEPTHIKVYRDNKYRGWSSMKIYNDLPDDPEDKGGMGNDIRTDTVLDPKKHKQKVDDMLQKAATQAKIMGEPGSIPGHIQRHLDEINSPELPWFQILQNKLLAYARDDYTMHRPNRRYMPDFYMPSMINESLGHCIAAADVSGSIWDELLSQIGAEIKYFWETLKPTSLRLISFDTEIRDNKVYEQGDSLDNLVLHGGGGTNVKPVLQYVRDEDPTITLIFTDGGFTMPEGDEIPGDVFWIIKGCPNFDPPYGEVIHFN